MPAAPNDAEVAQPGAWDPLGVTPHDGGANVAIWAAGADAVEFCQVHDDGTERRVELADNTFHVFNGFVPRLQHGDRYGFRVHGPWDPARGLRFNPNKLLLDPYARAVDGDLRLEPAVFAHVGSDDLVLNDLDSAPYVPKSVIVGEEFDWGNDHAPRTSWQDTVIYELHVKGFTKRHPEVPDRLRGTYAGLAEPAAIQHLVDLGISAVELLPIHQFVSEGHLVDLGLTNYWGYNSIAYHAPHGAYSSSGTRGQQTTEFKQMVKALHAAGIEVILDVVYNHTAEGDQLGPTLAFRGISNPSYYKLNADNPRYYADYTGCGNTFDARQPKVLQLITDSLRYWVLEMHVDGFRFDLASALARSFHDVDMLGSFLTTIEQDPVLRHVKLIAEPWDVGAGGYQVGEFPPLWTEWNDKYRDCLRDFWRGAAGVGELGWRMSGSADLYSSEGRRPYSSINFITAHDGFTLRDLVTYQEKHNEANLEDNADGSSNNRAWNSGVEGETDDPEINGMRHRRVRSMLACLLLSTGTPMVVAGDEMGRTQGGNNNAYCQDNDISWVGWELEPWQVDLCRFAQRLLELRRAHPAFRQRYFFDGRPVHEGGPADLAWFGSHGELLNDAEWHSPDTRSIGMFISGDMKGRGPGRTDIHDSSFLLLLNAAPDRVPFLLPPEPYGSEYHAVLDTAADVNGGMDPAAEPMTSGQSVPVEGFSCLLLEITKR